VLRICCNKAGAWASAAPFTIEVDALARRVEMRSKARRIVAVITVRQFILNIQDVSGRRFDFLAESKTA
jgi:hypothetical protein